MQNKETFNYVYSAKQQEEIKKIRAKYASPKEPDKMERIRRLDASVTKKGTVISLIVGIIGALVMGFGMSCCLVWTDTMLGIGIIVGVIGIAIVACAYPLYDSITKRERKKIAPEILRLTDELIK